MSKQPFLLHLDELRGRLVKSALVFLITAIAVYPCLPWIIDALVKPIGKIHFISPSEAFIAHIKLALLLGCFLSLPFWLYQLWAFICEGLKEGERRYVYFFGPFSLFLFLAGAIFAYMLIVPIALDFLLGFARDTLVPMITISEYISFIGTLLICFAIAFELPLIIAFLARVGLTSPDFLASKRRYAIIIIIIVSAIVTPPDVVTQLLMAGPLIFLYELGIVFARILYKRREQEQ